MVPILSNYKRKEPMITLPTFPLSHSRCSRLIDFLALDAGHSKAFSSLLAHTDAGERVGDKARYHIVRSSYRRTVFRGILDCLDIPCPVWAEERQITAEANRFFVSHFRDHFNKHRRELRKQPEPYGA